MWFLLHRTLQLVAFISALDFSSSVIIVEIPYLGETLHNTFMDHDICNLPAIF